MADSLEVIGSATGCGGGPQKKNSGQSVVCFSSPIILNDSKSQAPVELVVGAVARGTRALV